MINGIIKKCFFISIFAIGIHASYSWGATGHRVIGEVASQNIKNKTRKAISEILSHQSIASVSTFADDIKSDNTYHAFYTWHFVNFDFEKKYEDCEQDMKGDIVKGIQVCMDTLQSKSILKKDKVFYLKLLVHLVGDLHQPLHIGRKENKGGNDIKIKWFSKSSNLHRVWDGNMIDQYKMSYSELSNDLPYLTKIQKQGLQKGSLMDWVYESQKLAQTVYNSAKSGDALGYKYQYEYFATVKSQLQKGGLRLAKILDSVFK